MTTTVNNFLKNILCMMISILISLMELQFFENVEIFSFIFLIILAVTIPTVYLYFLPKNETIILFLYNIVLVYILDVFGKNIDINLFLATLFCIVLLFSQSLYTANAKKMNANNPSFVAYCLILIISLVIVAFISFFIYENVLKPNVDENNELTLLYETMDNENNKIGQDKTDQETNKNNGGGSDGGGSSAEEPPREPVNIKLILKFLIIIIICFIIIYILIRIIKYKLWLRKTLRSSAEKQIHEFYRYLLNSLSILEFKRNLNETPYEYLKVIESEDFPFSKVQFTLLTNVFVSTNYGKALISKDDYEKCLAFFYNISRTLRKKLGVRNYLFRYLIKVKC